MNPNELYTYAVGRDFLAHGPLSRIRRFRNVAFCSYHDARPGKLSLRGHPGIPSRYFRHSSVYYNVDSGIKKPEDFKGKRIGTPEYAMTAGVWIRGFLKDDYGVRA